MVLILNYDININIADINFLNQLKGMSCNYDDIIDESIIKKYYSIISYDEINQEYIDFKECSLFYIDDKKLVFSFRTIHFGNDISYIRKLKIKKLL